jgi:hypothetical protein
LGELAPSDGVVVAPDLGAVKLADRVGDLLGLPVALVRKRRTSGSDVLATGLTGDVRGRRPILVDDMITTGATITAAAQTPRSRTRSERLGDHEAGRVERVGEHAAERQVPGAGGRLVRHEDDDRFGGALVKAHLC